MGVDYRNIIMYGKEFDSFEDAMDTLQHLEVITDDEYYEACEDSEYNDPTIC